MIPKNDLPKTLDETFDFLDNMEIGGIEDWLKEDIKKSLGMAHSGLGMWLRNNLGLWVDPPNELKQWFFDNYFISHPDDISSLILINYHQRKNNIVPNLSEEANRYHEHWSKTDKDYYVKMRKHKLNKIWKKINSKQMT